MSILSRMSQFPPDMSSAATNSTQPPPLPPAISRGMIGYATAGPARPGLVSAIGVTSIVVGSIGIISALISGFYAGLFCFLALQGPGFGAAITSLLSGATFPRADRQTILRLVATPQSPMSQRRQLVLEAFLHDHGRQVFPAGSNPSQLIT